MKNPELFSQIDDMVIEWLSEHMQFNGGGAMLIAVHRTNWQGVRKTHFVVEVDDEAYGEDEDGPYRKTPIPGEQLYGENATNMRRLFVASVSIDD